MQTVNRAMVMPLKWPREKDAQRELGDRINAALDLSLRVANLAQAEIWRATIEHCRTAEKPAPHWGEARAIAVGSAAGQRLPSSCAESIQRLVWDRWRGKNSRGMRVWWSALHGLQSVPNMRRFPLPIRAKMIWGSKSHRPHLGRGGEPFIWLPLARLEKGKLEWVEVQLEHKAKAGDRRSYKTFVDLVEGRLKGREVQLYRAANGRVMVKFVVAMPVRERGDREGVFCVVTRADALWAGSKRGRPKDWWYNAWHLRELQLISDRKAVRDQRLREDAKAEDRRMRRKGRGPLGRMARETVKHQKRRSTALHKAARELVAQAVRRRVSTVVYDDEERGFCASLAWSELSGRVKEKLTAEGIEFLTADAYRSRLVKLKLADEAARFERDFWKLKGDDYDDDGDEADRD